MMARGVRAEIPSLQGLRAVAVVLVIAGHLAGSTGVLAESTWAYRLVSPVASLGVALFFAISGFLITRLLIAEQHVTGRVSLRLFYLRRVVRLVPALWLLLAVTAVLDALGAVDVPARDFLSALLFVTDYVPGESRLLFHTWSLAIEEQFYVLWPLVLVSLGRGRAPRVVAAAIVATPVVRLASYIAVPMWRGQDAYQFHQRYDALAAGCLLALMWNSPRARRAARHGRLLLVAGVGLVVASVIPGEILSGSAASAAGLVMPTVQAVGFGGVVAGAVSWAPPVLQGRVAKHVGAISYSLYLWQQMFVIETEKVVETWWLGLVCLVITAELSYRMAERPFEVIRRRLDPTARRSV